MVGSDAARDASLAGEADKGGSVASTSVPLGSAYANNTNDVGSALAIPADLRLRMTSTFTVHVRSDLTTR